MQRRGKPTWPEQRPSSAGLDHGHLAGPVDAIVNADAAIEAHEIGAAAEEHMLAVVDDLVDAWMQVGTCASAEIATAFDKVHAESRFGQRTGSAHAGNAAANDGHGFLRNFQYCAHADSRAQVMRVRPTARIASF